MYCNQYSNALHSEYAARPFSMYSGHPSDGPQYVLTSKVTLIVKRGLGGVESWNPAWHLWHWRDGSFWYLESLQASVSPVWFWLGLVYRPLMNEGSTKRGPGPLVNKHAPTKLWQDLVRNAQTTPKLGGLCGQGSLPHGDTCLLPPVLLASANFVSYLFWWPVVYM